MADQVDNDDVYHLMMIPISLFMTTVFKIILIRLSQGIEVDKYRTQACDLLNNLVFNHRKVYKHLNRVFLNSSDH